MDFLNTAFAKNISLSIDEQKNVHFDKEKVNAKLLIDAILIYFISVTGNTGIYWSTYMSPLIKYLHGEKQIDLTDEECNILLTLTYGVLYFYEYAQNNRTFNEFQTKRIINSFFSISLGGKNILILDAILLYFPNAIKITDNVLIYASEQSKIQIIEHAINNKFKIP